MPHVRSSLKLTTGKKFSLVGTPLGNELKDPSREKHCQTFTAVLQLMVVYGTPEVQELPDVFNDLDMDFSENPQAAQAYITDKRNQRKIREASRMLQDNLTLMHPLREGKKLLVLDIDYSTSNILQH